MRHLPWVLAWVASVGAAWYFGRETAPTTTGPSTEGLERADAGAGDGPTGARLEGSGNGSPRGGAAGGDGAPGGKHGAVLEAHRPEADRLRPVEVAVVPASKPLSLEGANTPEEVLARLFAYASAQLAAGKDGHLALYKTLDELLQKKTLEQVFDDRTDGPRMVYPLVRFLVERDAQVVDLAENVLRTAAEEPAFFEGTDDDTFEALAEGLGPILPGMVTEERLERMRGYAKAVLAAPEARQPKALRSSRNDLQRMLEHWVPALPSAEAAARLKTGQVTGREALALLRRVKPEDRGSLDLERLLGPLLDEGDVMGLSSAVLVGIDGRTLSGLDTRLIDAFSKGGRMNEWHLSQWLRATNRGGFDAARGFLEQALRQGGPTANAAALALLALNPRPSADTVDSLLRSYTVDPRVAGNVRASFGLR